MLALKPRGVEKPSVSDFLQVPTCFVFNCRVVERIIFLLDAHADSEAGSCEAGENTVEITLENLC